jgi:hypothetical protein
MRLKISMAVVVAVFPTPKDTFPALGFGHARAGGALLAVAITGPNRTWPEEKKPSIMYE